MPANLVREACMIHSNNVKIFRTSLIGVILAALAAKKQDSA